MSDLTEKEELDRLINHTKAGTAGDLVEMGVTPAAAKRAVAEEVKFGRTSGGNVLMERGRLIVAPSSQRECAEQIRADLPPEAFRNFSATSDEEAQWAAMERRLDEASSTYSREGLREQTRQAEIDRTANPLPDTPEVASVKDRLRAEVGSVL